MKLITPNSNLFKEVNWSEFSQWSKLSICDVKENYDGKFTSAIDQATLLVSDSLEPSDVIDAMVKNKSFHLVQKNQETFSNKIKVAAELMTQPNKYFDGIGKILLSSVLKKVEFKFSDPKHKKDMKETLLKFVQELGSQNVSESAEAIIEELYMNSILDAPIEAKKKNMQSDKYEKGFQAKITIELGEKDLVISCEDPFGSLDITKFLGRMSEVYSKGAGEVINLKGTGGAGLGCIIMFEHSSCMHIGVDREKKTIVTCVVPLGMSYRQRAQIKKSLHMFVV